MWESSGVLEMASLGLTWLPFATEENEDQRGGGISWLGTGGQLMTELALEPRPPVPTHCSSWRSFEFSSEVGAVDTLERTELGRTRPQGLAGGTGVPALGHQALQLR